MNSNKFQFQTAVCFEISKEEAVRILACHDADVEMARWLSQNCPVREPSDSYSMAEMKQKLGKVLCENAVDEAKQLTWEVPSTSEESKEGDII